MIKSIKLANAYPANKVGFIGKNISSLYNKDFAINFSIIILNDFFEQFVKENSIENKIYPLVRSLTKQSTNQDIEDASEKIAFTISNCDFSEELKEQIEDAYETLPWESSSNAGELLNDSKHKVNLIASPDYITAPLILPGVTKETVADKIKELYTYFFSKQEILYRINSEVTKKFAIAIILQRQEKFSASAFAYKKKNEDLIKVYVFPGKINPKDLMSPDEEIKPDQYEVLKDSLKLKSSASGKQSFKNIDDNGNFKRVECQINNFILNDAAAIEIARLTKKATIILEKEVQIIFEIKQDNASMMHISNIIDLQEDYFKNSINISSSQEIKQEENSDNSIEEMPSLDETEQELEEEDEEATSEISEEEDEKFGSEIEELDQHYQEIKQTNESLKDVEQDILSEKQENIIQSEEDVHNEETEKNAEITEEESSEEEQPTETEPEKEFEEEQTTTNEHEETILDEEEQTTTNEHEETILDEEIKSEPEEILPSEKVQDETKTEDNQEIVKEQTIEPQQTHSSILDSDKPLNKLMNEEEAKIIEPEVEEKNLPIENKVQENYQQEQNEQPTETEPEKEVGEEQSIANSEPVNILDDSTIKENNTLNLDEETNVEDILSEETEDKKDDKTKSSETNEDDFIM